MSIQRKARPISVLVLVFLLAFQALSGIYGGGTLVLDPSGELLKLPASLLDNAPFNSFLLPGLILLIVLGVMPLIVTFALWRRPRWNAVAWLEQRFGEHWAWIAAGVVALGLVIWLAVEWWMVGFSSLLLLYGIVALAILLVIFLPSTRRYYHLKKI